MHVWVKIKVEGRNRSNKARNEQNVVFMADNLEGAQTMHYLGILTGR